MCEKCNCKTSEMIYQEELVGREVEATKKNIIEHSLNLLFDSLENLETLDYKISSSSEGEKVKCEREMYIFNSLEALLKGLPDVLYKTSETINELVGNIDAKLF